MKQKILFGLLIMLAPFCLKAQAIVGQKDALVIGSVTDLGSGKALSNEIIVFKSSANGTEFQALSDLTGNFSLRLPVGSKYDLYILGFQDSSNQNILLDIPALANNARYDDKHPFVVPIQFEGPKSYVFNGCNFETGKSDLKPESYPVIDNLVEYLNRKTDVKIEIDGYTDDVGSESSNLTLSLARANTVRAYILMKGVSPDRVTAKGFGMEDPIADNSTAEGRAQNRRMEVKLLD
ncbi:MAG TPA: OmpA family protein [Ferruginibacter sp.]|jgi:OOP family OmpA-OmpF porin|nr:OmpA family protein [Ferruginibacter sp.]